MAVFDSQEQLLVILNNREEGVYLDLPVWEIGVCEDDCMENVLTSWEDGFSTRGRKLGDGKRLAAHLCTGGKRHGAAGGAVENIV